MTITPAGPNQIEILHNGAIILISYSTPVAAYCIDGFYYRTAQKHSATTTRHVKRWIGGADCIVKPQSWFDSLIK